MKGRILRLGKIASLVLGSNTLLSALSVAINIFLVRKFSIETYAIYTLVSSFLITVGSLADLNVSSALVTLGARVRGNLSELSSLLGAALFLRRVLLIIVGLVFAPLLFLLLNIFSLSTDAKVSLVVLTLANIFIQQVFTLQIAWLNATRHFGLIAAANIVLGLSRAALTVAVCLLLLPDARGVLLASLVATGFAIGGVGWASKGAIAARGKTEFSAVRQICAFVGPLIPYAVYINIKNQIFVFLLALVGAKFSVAEYGALTKFGLIFALLSSLTGSPLQSYAASLNTREGYTRPLLLVGAAVVAFSVIIESSFILGSKYWLAILGPAYAHLDFELVVVMAGSATFFLGSVLNSFLLARKITVGQGYLVPASMFALVVAWE